MGIIWESVSAALVPGYKAWPVPRQIGRKIGTDVYDRGRGSTKPLMPRRTSVKSRSAFYSLFRLPKGPCSSFRTPPPHVISCIQSPWISFSEALDNIRDREILLCKWRI